MRRKLDFFTMLCLVAIGCARAPAGPTDEAAALGCILDAAPEGWSLADSRQGEVPWGHVGSGPTGNLYTLVGPAPISFLWRDETGEWNSEPLAAESLELWIMPGGYRAGLRTFFQHHRPVPPDRVFSSRRLRVYGRVAHRLLSEERFQQLSRGARATSWSDVHEKSCSWTNWKTDMSRSLSDCRTAERRE